MGHRIQPTEEAKAVDTTKAAPRKESMRPVATPAMGRTERASTSRARRRVIIAASIVAVLVIAVLVAASLVSEPAKRYAERQANERLPDYQITIGKLRLQPFRLGVGLEDVVVRLRANPEPALAEIPQSKVRVRLLPLFTGKIDVNLHIENPQLAATDQQVHSILHNPKKEDVKEPDVGWQDRLRDMMPVRVSLSLSNGDIRYHADRHVEPIQVHQVAVTASNLTNRPRDNEQFPSELRVNAHFGDEGELAVNSRADFLAKPSPRIEGDVKVQHLTLPTLRPLTGPYHVQLRQGAFDMTGHIHYAAPHTVVDVNEFVLDGAKVDYVHMAETKDKEAKQAHKGAEHVKEAHKDPSVVVKVSHGKVVHSDVGFINKEPSRDYRVFMSDMNLELQNFSNRPEDGMGTMKLTGNFMGSGPTVVNGNFRAEKPNPDFDVQVRIVKTQVSALNKLLEAYGQLDAKQGTFAFFSDMKVKNNRIDGYVKPFLKDVEVYDPDQDTDKQTMKKLYEAVVNGVLDLFKNSPTEQVATKTDLSGPVENPHTSTWQVLGKLVENAFFKAILPGFEGIRKA
jgi:hypothetical protein